MLRNQYDVILQNDLNEEDASLVLMKFPGTRSQFENRPDTIKMELKPKSLKLKMDVLLNSTCDNYCKESAAYLASKSAPKSFASERVDKNTYTSTRVEVDDGQLYVAKLVNGQLVCRPVSDFLMVRPDFSHFDVKEEPDCKEEVKPISVKFATGDRQASTPGKPPTQSTIAQQQQAAAEDPDDAFSALKYIPLTSRESTVQRERLFGKEEPRIKCDPDAQDSKVDIKPNIAHLIADIKPKIEMVDPDDIYTDLNQPSSQIGSTGATSQKKSGVLIKQRVKDCLFKAKIVSYEEVHQYIRGYGQRMADYEHIPINNKEILDALSEFAVLVQGNWVIKSGILYGDSSERESTDVTGISINLFITARDYLLWLFTQSRIVSRLEYSRNVKLPDYDTLQLFTQLATFRPDLRKWELKLATDDRFVEQFPDVVNRQNTFWKVRRANKLAIFN